MSIATLPAPRTVTSPASTRPSAITCFLCLGLLLRLVHFALNHTIWYDEAVLLANILGKDYAGLLGPLDYEVAAPPLYLWGLRTIYLIFGDHPYLWRLPSLLTSCLCMLMMTALARRTMRPGAAAIVVGLVAFSDAFVWLGCNVKPYIIDALLANCLIYGFIATSSWKLERSLLLFLAAAPCLICVSYPMLFLYASVMAAFLPRMLRCRQASPWAVYVGLALTVLATFCVLHFGPMAAQRVPGLVAGWKNKMPNLNHLASVPGWIAGNTFLVFHYCFNPVGVMCAPLTVLGAWWCLRHGRLDWICLGVGPIVLCLLAAVAQIYPYSNNRLIMFAAPGIGLMTGLGMMFVSDAVRRPRLAEMIFAWVLIAPEIALSLYRLPSPWYQPDSAGAAAVVRSQRQNGDVIATDEDAYQYYLFGEVNRPRDVTGRTGPAGERVWFLYDHATPEFRRGEARRMFPELNWTMKEETICRGSTVVLFERRGN